MDSPLYKRHKNYCFLQIIKAKQAPQFCVLCLMSDVCNKKVFYGQPGSKYVIKNFLKIQKIQ